MKAPDRGWAFKFCRLDYAWRKLGYLDLTTEEMTGAVEGASYSLETDAQMQATMTCTIRKSAWADLFNEYLQPEVWVYMGSDETGETNDGDRFAKIPLLILRVTDAPDYTRLTTQHYLTLTLHDAIAEILNSDQITNSYAASVGDVVTTKIRAFLAMTPLTRLNIADSSIALARNIDWPPGTTFLKIIDDLLKEINYVRWSDHSGFLNIQPWRDPSTVLPQIEYTDDGTDTIFTEARVQRDIFGLPNHLTLYSTDDTWSAVAENLNPSSPISQVNLKSLDGSPLIRHAVETGVEAASLEILQEKAQRRMLEISTIPEKFEMKSRLKPYHEPQDAAAITRQDFGFYGTAFEFKKMTFDLKHDAEQVTTFTRNIALS